MFLVHMKQRILRAISMKTTGRLGGVEYMVMMAISGGF